jgi:hypothetical protein
LPVPSFMLLLIPLFYLLLTLVAVRRLFLFCFSYIESAVALAHRPATVMFQVCYPSPCSAVWPDMYSVAFSLGVVRLTDTFLYSDSAKQSIRESRRNRLDRGHLKNPLRARIQLVAPRVATCPQANDPPAHVETPERLYADQIPPSLSRNLLSGMMMRLP